MNEGMERYRTTATGEERNDFDTAVVALSDQVNKLMVVNMAINGFESGIAHDIDTGILMGAQEILSDILVTMNQAINILEDLGVEGS